MTKFLIIFVLLYSWVLNAQNKVEGLILDDFGIPISNAEIQIGETLLLTDLDGKFEADLPEGEYEFSVFSLDYDQYSQNIKVLKDKVLNLNITLRTPQPAETNLNELVVSGTSSSGSASYALSEQKKATEVKEIVGSEQLKKQGVTEAADAVSKISGVTNNKSFGDVFIRGLGDRYLNTTLNGLPIPSNRDDKRNIELDIIPSTVIENVALSKTYSPNFYANFGSGNININTKELQGRDFYKIGLKSGLNSNNLKVFSKTRTTPNYRYFGFYNTKQSEIERFYTTSWDPQAGALPFNFGFNIGVGKNIKLGDRTAKLLFNTAYSNRFEHQTGTYKYFRANRLRRFYNNTEEFIYRAKLNGNLSFEYAFNNSNKIKLVSVFLNEFNDRLYEGGRNSYENQANGQPSSYIFDKQPKETEVFYRDQRTIQNQVWVNQLIGNNTLKGIDLNWALGYNLVNGGQPNTRTSEVVYDSPDLVQFAQNTDYDTSRSFIDIKENEFNGYLNADFSINDHFSIGAGISGRQKSRDFSSQYIGLTLDGVTFQSIDDYDAILNPHTYNNDFTLRQALANTYNGTHTVFGGNLNFKMVWERIWLDLGARYELNNQNIEWNVSNYPGGYGDLNQDYNNFYPSLNSKFEIADRHFIRLGASRTLSVPDIKDLSPFEYKDARQRLFRGNPELIFPELYNADLKYEFFPTPRQIVSVAGFGKIINDPINIVQNVSSAGFYRPENTGKQATVFGVELETQLPVFQGAKNDLNLIFNATRMWTNQDLYEKFQYNDNKEVKLQGAADFIINGSLNFNTLGKKPLSATLTANYSSDKIFSLGSPNSGVVNNQLFTFNDNTIEKGYLTLDFVLEKQFSDKVSISLFAKNLLNPKIRLTQDNNVTNLIKTLEGTTEQVGEADLESYRKGVLFNVGFNYNL